jgi:holo-[acyl-carrier protein] synthase
MIFGIGTDIIEVNRLEQLFQKGDEYLESIFTKNEIDYCEKKGRKAEHYAARFAAKEACLKALGTGWRDGIRFSEIEVVNDELGKPLLQFSGTAQERIQANKIRKTSVSLSHVKEIAIAVVILEN